MFQSYHYLIVLGFGSIMLLEAILSSQFHLNLYNLKDTLASLTIALVSIFLNLSFKGFSLMVLSWIYFHSYFTITNSFVYWILLFILTDLIAYFFHYISHKSRFFWASHIVHHSSEKYNLSAGIRLPITNFFYRFLFYSPLCLIGFNPIEVLLMDSFIYLYNFFLHTEFIRKIGWMEYVLNTPSHHRVHHGKNDKYLDKNFGGILIIWDRLFNTFQEEDEKPTFGTTKNLNSINPFKIISKEWIDIFKDAKKAKSAGEIFRIVFFKP